MFYGKEVNNKIVVVEFNDKNLCSLYEREGFFVCDKKGQPLKEEIEE